ncbi:uncharacterized protein EKO05_0000738 [Ascochyta rabiei]|uniref:uncharacterized protein n=1 Tax=Didymella rabiei TaxID=5454 RepID=UPI0018FF9C08|nr:uncharacterized protein EKO05_0000738 [Ascochyta rabiei]UPX10066.1 hypothetical protein EKO05_0000738 [Ascochyta rabiei]
MPSSRLSGYEDWNDWVDEIDNGDIINYITHELRSREIYLSESDIRQGLEELNSLSLSRASHHFGDAREDQLMNIMKRALAKDLDSNGSQGLYRSRSRFLTFCFVARRLGSKELAGVLLRFFVRAESNILDGEKSFLLTEWCLALQQLESLVSDDRLNDAFGRIAKLGPPLFEEWRRPGPHHSWIMDMLRFFNEMNRHDHGRGRDQLQVIAPHDLPPRRLSVPPLRRPFTVDIPPYPRTVYNTPMISPRHGVAGLHLQQQMHAFELNRLRRDMDDIRYRQ